MSDWPHQTRCVQDVLDGIERGVRRQLVTAPTGSGKTRIMLLLARAYLDAGKKVAAYTNRRLLREQMSGRAEEAGLDAGVRAAGEFADPEAPFQVCSMPTEVSRLSRQGSWELHPADLVLVDEAHLHAGDRALAVLGRHAEQGASIVGFTATPLGLADAYDELLIGCTVREARQCGALVPAKHYGPDEPDFRQYRKELRQLDDGDGLSESLADKVMRTPGLFGRVLEWYRKINPDQRPTVLFGPSVSGSLWFAHEFEKAGIPSAHIDGTDVWWSGKFFRTSQEARADVLAASKCGDVKVVCNRFVLREGIDCPWWSHGILATPFGLQSYLQAGGRLLRSFPGKAEATIQDHAGSWHRHGSLNCDRDWRLDDTAAIVTGLRIDAMRERKEPEPVRCPKCGMVRVWRGPECPTCGQELPRGVSMRSVVQSDGTLRQLVGPVYKPRRLTTRPNGPALWERMYWRSRTAKGRRTFRAAAALFAQENNWGWPDPSWPLMPKVKRDWFLLVGEVPIERLVPKAG